MISDNLKQNSIVRGNLMKDPHYSPYCGDFDCVFGMPRTKWNGSQFECKCGWVSRFPVIFIDTYKKMHNLS